MTVGDDDDPVLDDELDLNDDELDFDEDEVAKGRVVEVELLFEEDELDNVDIEDVEYDDRVLLPKVFEVDEEI